MEKLKTAEDFFALAIEKYQNKKYPEAIEAFNQSLELKEEWQSYQSLGLTLFKGRDRNTPPFLMPF